MLAIRTSFRPPFSSVLTTAGGGVVIAGAFLPWMTYFAGLVPLRGIIGLNGRLLVGCGVAAIGCGVWAAIGSSGARRRLRYASATLGIGVVAAAAWLLIQLRELTHAHAMHPMMVARPGVGLFVVLSGGLLLLVGASGNAPRHGALARPMTMSPTLVPVGSDGIRADTDPSEACDS